MSNLLEHAKAIRTKQILSAQFNLTNFCVSKCKYCRKYTWPKAELDLQKAKNAIAYLEDCGLKTICFSGGDPIYYYGFKEIITYCKQLKLKVSIITTLITTDTELLHFIAKNVDKISVSVDGDYYTYSKCRGVDALHIVEQNLKLINTIRKCEGLRVVRLSSTISALNYNLVQWLYQFAKNTSSCINYYLMHDYDEYQLNPTQLETLKQSLLYIRQLDMDNITNVADVLNGSLSNCVDNIVSTTCSIPYIHCLVNADGNIYPCCKLLDDNGEYVDQIKYSYGTIYSDNLPYEFGKRFNTDYDICTYCKGCWGRYTGIIDTVNEILSSKNKELWI